MPCAEPGCRKDAVVIPSAKLINTLYDYIASEKPDFMRKADTDELVLLSHSLGGFIAFKTLAGEAAAPQPVNAT